MYKLTQTLTLTIDRPVLSLERTPYNDGAVTVLTRRKPGHEPENGAQDALTG
jgi:hypothetical protein